MEKYRKQPVEVDAKLLTADESVQEEVLAWINKEKPNASPAGKGGIYILTSEGDILASVGDYIIKGVAGEFYPCKPDIFASTYSKVLTSYEDILVKHSLLFQSKTEGEPMTEEEIREEFKGDDWNAFKAPVYEYATQVAKDTLARAAENVKHVPQMYAKLMETEIVLP